MRTVIRLLFLLSAFAVGAQDSALVDTNGVLVHPTNFLSANGIAPLASPALTGNPTAQTASVGDNDTSISTTAFVTAAIEALKALQLWQDTNAVLTKLAALTGGNSSNFFKGTGAFAQVTTNDIPNLVTMLGGLQPLDADLTSIAGLTWTDTNTFLRGDKTLGRDGQNWTNLNASQLLIGTVPMGRLALGSTNSSAGLSGYWTDGTNRWTSRDGQGLTNLNGSEIRSGTISTGVLPANLALLSTLNGSGLTNLNGSAISSGTIATSVLPGALGTLSTWNGGGVLTNAYLPVITYVTNQSLTAQTVSFPSGSRYCFALGIAPGGPGGSGRRGAAGSLRTGGAGGSGGGIGWRWLDISKMWTNYFSVLLTPNGDPGAAVTADNTNGNAGTNASSDSAYLYVGPASATNQILRIARGQAGAGGNSTGAAAGGTTSASTTLENGTTGGSSSSTGLAGANGATVSSSTHAGTGGGAGGGITTGDVESAGGNGGINWVYWPSAAIGTGGAARTSGLSMASPYDAINLALRTLLPFNGAGGGGSSTNGAAGSGGAGFGWGSGGGGGGASLNGNNSGAGGAGGPGMFMFLFY